MKSFVERFKTEIKIRRDIKDLRSHTDRELNDLGISRTQIESAVRGKL